MNVCFDGCTKEPIATSPRNVDCGKVVARVPSSEFETSSLLNVAARIAAKCGTPGKGQKHQLLT